MKKMLFVLSFLLIMQTGFTQVPAAHKHQDEGKLYMNPRVPPSFPGGEPAWQSFVASHLDKNIFVKNNAPAGTYTITVSFIVGMDSVISNVGCKNDPGYGMCGEAIRLARISGKWIPAKENGRIVNGFKFQPIVFRIN